LCLILFAYKVHPRYRLVLGANRDEFYVRPTAPLDFWQDYPEILAGRDLEQLGTWMGVTRSGRLAAVTNFRDPAALRSDAHSRGRLVTDFLTGRMPPDDYLSRIEKEADRYNGFNLIIGDASGLFYFSKFEKIIRQLGPGIYGLSNHLLDTPWPKVAFGKKQLGQLLRGNGEINTEALLKLLEHQIGVPDAELPATGVGLEWERILSPIFITSPDYGTRSSSVLTIDIEGRIRFTERTWKPDQAAASERFTRSFELPGQQPARE
jgi:uncharacterized protein with NRDE domain